MKLRYALTILVLLVLGFAFYVASPKLLHLSPRKPGLSLALDQPDALIRSASLARLPRDLLQLPVAREVLTEDLVDYYETQEDRLAIAGALKRIAFEHHLSLPDRVLESVFDEEAEVALWRGPDGSLKYYLLAMTRNRLAKLIQFLASALPGDTQLHRVGKLPGRQIELYALDYGYQRRLLFAAQGDRGGCPIRGCCSGPETPSPPRPPRPWLRSCS